MRLLFYVYLFFTGLMFLLCGAVRTFATIGAPHLTGFHESWEALLRNGTNIIAQYDRDQMEKNERFMILKSLYEKTVLTHARSSKKTLIPKVLHQIYLTDAGKEMPKIYKQLQQIWITKHPGWRYKLWGFKEIEQFGLINKKKFDEALGYAAKSDIARYEILYRLGGVYVDTDFLCLKPLDKLNNRHDFYVGMEPHIRDDIDALHRFIISQAIIGSRPGHPILKKCIEELANKSFALGEDPVFMTGPIFFGDCLFSAIDTSATSRSVVLPPTYFFPIGFGQGSLPFSEIIANFSHPETFGIHLWAGSWHAKGDFSRNEESLVALGESNATEIQSMM